MWDRRHNSDCFLTYEINSEIFVYSRRPNTPVNIDKQTTFFEDLETQSIHENLQVQFIC